MIPLLKKELRALLPLFLLLFVLFAVDLVYAPFLERIDQRSWARHAGVEPGEGTAYALVTILVGLLVAYSLFPREHDERTIEFLYSLPVGRGAIYLAKVLAGTIALWAGFVSGQVAAFLLQLPNPTSFSGGEFRLDVALTGLGLQCAMGLVVLSHGVVLSFFRRFGLVLYGVAAWILILLERLDPALDLLDPTRLVSMEYDGLRLLVPWGALALHLGIAAAALGVGWLLWMGPAERLWVGMSRAFERPAGKVALGCGTALLVVLLLALVTWIAFKEGGDDGPPSAVRYRSWESARTATRHFQFTYPSDVRGRALELIGAADEGYAAVCEALGAEAGAPIVVDLTEVSSEHAGLTAWQKIRMDVASEEDPTELLHTFLHETTHALSLQESARRMSDDAGACRFFSEGLAEWVAHRLMDAPARLRASRLHAVAAVTRQELPFHLLCDDDALRARHDPHLVYPVGETWVEALARCYGAEAPGKVLRAMARPGAPRGLDPLPFWQETLRAAGCDLERVTSEWHELLAELEEDAAEALATIPRLSGGPVGQEDGVLIVVAKLDRPPPPGSRAIVRLREDPDTADHELITALGLFDADERRVTFRLDRRQVYGSRFELQFGIHLRGLHLPICEPWQGAIAPR